MAEEIKLEYVDILLDNDKINYQSGQNISGSIKIKLNGVLDMSIVTIVLRSMSEVKWVENPGTRYHRAGHVYRDEEEYLNIIYEIPDKVRKTKINAGVHSFSFVFKLPDDTPSSIDTDYGFISYWIEVIINDDSYACDVFRDRKYFIVESPFRGDNLYLTVGGGTEKDLGILSLGTGKVRIDANIRKKGHIPGETVEVHCLVTNTSTAAVTPRASFFQTQIFMAKERHKTVDESTEPVVGEQVDAGETRFQIIPISIPKDAPLSMKSGLITIKYFIHVTLDIPHAIDLHLNLPLIVTNESALSERSRDEHLAFLAFETTLTNV